MQREESQQHDQIGTEDLVQSEPAPSAVHSEHTGSGAREHAALIEDADGARFRSRWHTVQEEFVDDPRRAVQDADRLVAELMQTLATTFAERKQSLEDQWRTGGDAQTEDLRVALRSYRSFFDQLLPR
jgi:hypothetical protein